MTKILVVDDDDLIRDGLKTFLATRGHSLYTAGTGDDAVRIAKEIKPHIVFLDIGLPDRSGLDVLSELQYFDRTIRVIMISAAAATHIVTEATRRGASDYVTKPFTMDYLNNVVMVKIYEQMIEHERKTVIQICRAIARALEKKSNYTRGHSDRVMQYADWIADELETIPGWEWLKTKREFLRNAALLHDIGKVGILDNILNKESKLTEEEKKSMREHPVMGVEIIKEIDDLVPYHSAILYHHERWDGDTKRAFHEAYPKGLKGEEIPPEARILSVADAYDAMTSTRPYNYRRIKAKSEALEDIEKNKGKQFDPVIAEAFIRAMSKRNIIEEFEK